MARLSEILIGCIVASVFILVMGKMAGETTKTYNVSITNSFNSTYEKFDELLDFSDELSNKTKDSDIIPEANLFDNVFNNFIKVITIFFKLPTIMTSVITSTFSDGDFAFSGADFIPTTIVLILSLIVVFLIVGAVLRGNV